MGGAGRKKWKLTPFPGNTLTSSVSQPGPRLIDISGGTGKRRSGAVLLGRRELFLRGEGTGEGRHHTCRLRGATTGWMAIMISVPEPPPFLELELMFAGGGEL